MPAAPSETGPKTQLARTQDGNVVVARIEQIGKNDEEAKLALARQSGARMDDRQLIAGLSIISAGVSDLSGTIYAFSSDRGPAISAFVTTLFVLGIGGLYTLYVNRKIEQLENGIRQIQSGEQLSTLTLPQAPQSSRPDET